MSESPDVAMVRSILHDLGHKVPSDDELSGLLGNALDKLKEAKKLNPTEYAVKFSFVKKSWAKRWAS
jgi:hypothetical protein